MPHASPCGWRDTLWHIFVAYLHGTFPQNSSNLIVNNPVKNLSCAVEAVIRNLSQGYTQGKKS